VNPDGVDHALPGDDSRRLIRAGRGEPYVAVATLAEARMHADFAVVLSGDYGGQVYLTAPIALVRCGEDELRQLLWDLDATEWADPDGASLAFERVPVGHQLPGGMGGGIVAADIWVHPGLDQQVSTAAMEVVRGHRARIPAELVVPRDRRATTRRPLP
jgi:hypothetical protein